jgi:hypothetical protein
MHSVAQHLQSQGRGNDSVLVHMTPREVGGLQALAQAHGGTLTRNPTTGLPEAGFLDSILPIIAGIGLNFILPGSGLLLGSGALEAGLLTGGATAAITGDIGKGLMAGLGAYGGFGLGDALSGMGAAASAAPSASITAPGVSTAAAAPAAPGILGTQAVNIPGQAFTTSIAPETLKQVAANSPATLANMGAGVSQLGTKGGLAALGNALNTTQMVGLGGSLLGAMEPSGTTTAPKEDKPTVSLSQPQPLNRQVRFPGPERNPYDSSEYQYFTPVGGSPSTITRLNPTVTLAKGGNVHLEDGAFVVDARTVSELGNGSSSAGQDILARLGGRPIKGPGDGVSDSIHANIGGRQEARVARDEVKFSPDAVKRVGGGSAQKGAQRLYALMHKAQQARKTAKRGEDSGLAALVTK